MSSDEDNARIVSDVAQRAAAEIRQRGEAAAAQRLEEARLRLDAILEENRSAMAELNEVTEQHLEAVRDSTVKLHRALTDTIERAKSLPPPPQAPATPPAIAPPPPAQAPQRSPAAGKPPASPPRPRRATPAPGPSTPPVDEPAPESEDAWPPEPVVGPALEVDAADSPIDAAPEAAVETFSDPVPEPATEAVPESPALEDEEDLDAADRPEPTVDASSEVRALAAQMAAAGTDRAAIERRLRERYRLADPASIVDEASELYG